MEPRVELLKSTKLIGIHMKMSLAKNKTAELWQKFMTRRAEVRNRSTRDYISMQRYGKDWHFSPEAPFQKWAAVEVSSFSEVPHDMDTYTLSGGLYAVFVHQGPASAAVKTMQYIFGQWLPGSHYRLDSREHFEILPDGYNPLDSSAQEEIWVPVMDHWV